MSFIPSPSPFIKSFFLWSGLWRINNNNKGDRIFSRNFLGTGGGVKSKNVVGRKEEALDRDGESR